MGLLVMMIIIMILSLLLNHCCNYLSAVDLDNITLLSSSMFWSLSLILLLSSLSLMLLSLPLCHSLSTINDVRLCSCCGRFNCLNV